jgi:hypothetical protein
MKKEFLPYEQALELKELGFDEPCFAYYDVIKMELDTISSEVCERLCKHDTHFKAPTFSQAFRFFRENYGLEGISQRAEDKVWYKFSIYLYLEDGKRIRYGGYEYLTSEEAELECLKKLIEIVKNK